MSLLSCYTLAVLTYFLLVITNAQKHHQNIQSGNDFSHSGHHKMISATATTDQPEHRVIKAPAKKNSYSKEYSQCPYSESKIVLSLVLKSHDWDDIVDNKKNRALNKMSKFFAVPKDYIRLESISKQDIYEMTKKSIKRGHNNKNEGKKTLGKAEFVIGCGQSYFTIGEPIQNQIGQQMKDRSIDDITGLNFGWWVIWKKRVSNRVQRFKRQAVEGSGEEDYDYDYGEDDDDESITEVPPETTHAHRHHHGGSKQQDTDLNSFKQTDTTKTLDNNEIVETKIAKHKKNDLKSSSAATAGGINNKNTEDTEDTDDNKKNPVTDELDDISKSVSKLESDITKTIENANRFNEEILKNKNKLHDNHHPSISSTTTPNDVDDSFAGSKFSGNAEEAGENDLDDDDYIIEDISTEMKLVQHGAATEASASAEVTAVPPTTLTTSNNRDVKNPVNSEKEVFNTAVPEVQTTTMLSIVRQDESTTSTAAPTTVTLPPTLPTKKNRFETTISTTVTEESTTSSAIRSRKYENPTTTEIISTTVTENLETTTSFPSATSVVSIFSAKEAETRMDSRNLLPTTEREDNIETTIIPEIEATTQVPTTVNTTPSATTTTAATTTTTPSTTTTTEYIEPAEPFNSLPEIRNRLAKQRVTAGKPFVLPIPLETFYDNEDGTNLRLELYDKSDQPLKSNSWLQFDQEKREIYGLPLEDNVSRYQYKLYAYDSKNQTVNETVDISVQQHQSNRNVNHEITLGIKLNEKFKNTVDWQIRLIKGIVETLNDNSIASVVVRKIRQNSQDPFLYNFIYTNESLPKDRCPEEKLDDVIKRLDTRALLNSINPEITIKTVSGQQIGQCQKQQLTRPKPTLHMTKNYPPVPRNQVDRVNATIGQLLIFKVPADTFYDPEDNTDLKLSLLTLERGKLNAKHWLQFDSKNQEFYGIPKYNDYGQEEFLLVAEDNEGLNASDALIVEVTQPPKRDYSVVFKVTLGIPYSNFNSSSIQRRFVERVAQLLNDPNTSHIQIRSIQPGLEEANEIVVSFFNTSLYRQYQRCPDDEIEVIRNVWLHHDMIRERVRKTLGSEFDIKHFQSLSIGSCQSNDMISQEIPPTKTQDKKKHSFKDDYLLTFVLPAIIILAMLLLASIIACVLHRRRMTGKMEIGDEEERKSFRSKGIPVIFQDELDEKPEIGNKSPIILKDEKPPLLPPSYNSTNLDGDNDVDEYVPPPAVMLGTRETRGKSPVTPSYRKPPPYVSP